MRRILLASSLLLVSLLPAAPALAALGHIEASPEVVSVPPSGVGTTTILWYVSGAPEFYITVNCGGGGGETVFASSGEGSYSQDAPWITLGSACTFYLRADSPNGTLLSATTVIGVGPVGSLSASPETVVIPPGSYVGTTNIAWNGQGASVFHVTVQCGGAETLFGSTGPGYYSQDAPWITVGQTCLFRLRANDPYTGTEVANVTVTGVAGSAITGTIAASPQVIEIPFGQNTGSTEIFWNSNASVAYVTMSCYGTTPVFFAASGPGYASATASGISAGATCTFELHANSQNGEVLDSVTVTTWNPNNVEKKR